MKEIGRICSPFKTKFGIPKQSGMALSDRSEVWLGPELGADCVRGLAAGSFIWLLWIFDRCGGKSKELVRPPKLGGNEKMGVFATRSPFRPNNIGLSLVRLLNVRVAEGRAVLTVQGADLADGTPIMDIKPYHSKADVPWEAAPGAWFEDNEPEREVVVLESAVMPRELETLVKEVLACDPRPAYHKDPARIYSARLGNKSYGEWDIRWRTADGRLFEVVGAQRLTDDGLGGMR